MSTLRKYIGAAKDTASVSIARISGRDHKALDVAIVKATSHVQRPAKQADLKAIFNAISARKPRADVVYCIYALARRLSRTQNWVVALKTLMVIHGALREVDRTFREAFINHGLRRSRILDMTHFRDDSTAEAMFYSAWVRAYALFLEERLECFRVLKSDVHIDQPTTTALSNATFLLSHLPQLQQLLFRALNCQPEGAPNRHPLIHHAFSMVASESIKIYTRIREGVLRLVNKVFEIHQVEARQAFAISKRAINQTERFLQFYQDCKYMIPNPWEERFLDIEEVLLQAMEDSAMQAPMDLTAQDKEEVDKAIVGWETPEENQAFIVVDSLQPHLEEIESSFADPHHSSYLDELDRVVSELKEKKKAELGINPVDVDEENGNMRSCNKTLNGSVKPDEELGKETTASYDEATRAINDWTEDLNPFLDTFISSSPGVTVSTNVEQITPVLTLRQKKKVAFLGPQPVLMNPFDDPCNPVDGYHAEGIPPRAYALHPNSV